MTTDRVRIFDRKGDTLAEFRANVTRSWVIGNEGRASFTLSSLDTGNVDIDVIKPGNWLLVENDYLADWVGVIDFPREWGFREVTIHAYTPERLFQWRRGPLQLLLRGSAGAIFESYINLVNKAEDTILQPGNIWKNGATHERTVNPTRLNGELRNLYLYTGEEYQWRADIGLNGNLVVYGDWQQRIGTSTNLTLFEGIGGGNIEATQQPLIENEPVENDVLGYGDGMTWLTKPLSKKVDITSVDFYGLRQGTVELRGVTVPATITEKTQQYLDTVSNPGRVFDVVALDSDGSIFRFLRQGNTVRLVMQSCGFLNGTIGTDTTVRILGMGFNPIAGNRVPLILKEIL
jgi:hypothetical protein